MIEIVIGGLVVAMIAFIAFGLIRSAQAKAHLKQRLLSEGERATARVLSARQTGTFINDNPQVELELEVQRTTGAPFTLMATKVIPALNVGAVEVGKTLNVLVLPSDPTKLLIDEPWNR